MKSLAKVVEILKKEFSMISTRINTNLSDRLGFDSLPYPKSFMSLMWMKDYHQIILFTFILFSNFKILKKSMYF